MHADVVSASKSVNTASRIASLPPSGQNHRTVGGCCVTAEVCPYPAKSNEAKKHDSRRSTCRSSHRPSSLAFELFLSHCCPDGLLSAALAPSPTYQDLDPPTPSYQADLTSDPDSSLRRSICLASCHTSSSCHGNRHTAKPSSQTPQGLRHSHLHDY